MEGNVRAAARAPRSHVRISVKRRRAQATLEFAIAAPLFFMSLLGAIDAGLWAVQTNAEVAAVESAARAAASAGTSPLATAAPDAHQVAAAIAERLKPALFGTRLVAWCDPAPTASCAPSVGSGVCSGAACRYLDCPATPKDVQEIFGPRVIAVCVHERRVTPCAAGSPDARAPYCSDSPMVTVRIVGYLASLVPPGFGSGAAGGELPTDIGVTTHTLRFAP